MSHYQKLERQLAFEKEQRWLAQQMATRHREAAEQERKKRERIERRVHRGVCPECQRSFTNLRRHMATKHGEKQAR